MRQFVVTVNNAGNAYIAEVSEGTAEHVYPRELFAALGVNEDVDKMRQEMKLLVDRLKAQEEETAKYRSKVIHLGSENEHRELARLLAAALTRSPPEAALQEALRAHELIKLRQSIG